MSKNKYDAIVVTGCSYSCGMEMNDHLLPKWKNENERYLHIIKHVRDNNLIDKNVDLTNLREVAVGIWQEKEREQSWPTMLEKITGIPVFNLAKIGASLGYSFLTFQQFCKEHRNKFTNMCVVHQIPYKARMYLKFNKKIGRVAMLPKSTNLNFSKKYYANELEMLHQTYKKRISHETYIDNFFKKITYKLHRLSVVHNIDEYYFFSNPELIPDYLQNKILIRDLKSFRKNYTEGAMQHPNDPKFSIDVAEICRTTFL